MSLAKTTADSPQRRSTVAAAAPVFCFAIQALTEPGVMPRVLELFAKRNLVPDRWHSDVGGPGGENLSIDLQVSGLDARTAEYVANCIRQLAYVETVLTSEKGFG